MITAPLKKPSAKGSSLIEVVIAVGVLAVAVPLVFGTMVQTSGTSLSAQAETRSSWIIPACMEELQLAMRGESPFIGRMTPGKEFPSGGGPVILAFSSEGRAVGKTDASSYERGIRTVSGEPVLYLASLSGTLPSDLEEGKPPYLDVKIVLEYPAAAPASKRQKIEFYTRLP